MEFVSMDIESSNPFIESLDHHIKIAQHNCHAIENENIISNINVLTTIEINNSMHFITLKKYINKACAKNR